MPSAILPSSLAIPRPTVLRLSSLRSLHGPDHLLRFNLRLPPFDLSAVAHRHRLPPVRMGGGPRTFPGGVSKWQWKRMQAKKAKQLLKARLLRERHMYEMRKRAELKAAVSELERPWEVVERAPNLFSRTADEQVKVLADRFCRPGGFDMWSDRDGPRLFRAPDGLPSARFFPKGAVHSVKPYGLVGESEGKDLTFDDWIASDGEAEVSSSGVGRNCRTVGIDYLGTQKVRFLRDSRRVEDGGSEEEHLGSRNGRFLRSSGSEERVGAEASNSKLGSNRRIGKGSHLGTQKVRFLRDSRREGHSWSEEHTGSRNGRFLRNSGSEERIGAEASNSELGRDHRIGRGSHLSVQKVNILRDSRRKEHSGNEDRGSIDAGSRNGRFLRNSRSEERLGAESRRSIEGSDHQIGDGDHFSRRNSKIVRSSRRGKDYGTKDRDWVEGNDHRIRKDNNLGRQSSRLLRNSNSPERNVSQGRRLTGHSSRGSGPNVPSYDNPRGRGSVTRDHEWIERGHSHGGRGANVASYGNPRGRGNGGRRQGLEVGFSFDSDVIGKEERNKMVGKRGYGHGNSRFKVSLRPSTDLYSEGREDSAAGDLKWGGSRGLRTNFESSRRRSY